MRYISKLNMMPMDKIYTQKEKQANEKSVRGPKPKTVDFLKNFARAYSYQTMISTSFGSFSMK